LLEAITSLCIIDLWGLYRLRSTLLADHASAG
jgi:hypothetical protein